MARSRERGGMRVGGSLSNGGGYFRAVACVDAGLLHRFDDLDFLLQQGVYHFVQRDAFLGGMFGEIGLDFCVEVDGQTQFCVGPEELSAFGIAEIVFGFH